MKIIAKELKILTYLRKSINIEKDFTNLKKRNKSLNILKFFKIIVFKISKNHKYFSSRLKSKSTRI